MKRIFSLIYILTCVGISFSQCAVSKKATMLIRELGQNHYAPLQLTSENGHLVLNEFFLQIDPHRVLFDRDDIDQMHRWSNILLDTNSIAVCDFIDEIELLCKTRISGVDDEIKALASAAPVFSDKEKIQLYLIPNKEFESNSENRRKRIQKLYRYEYLALAYRDKSEGISLKDHLARSGEHLRKEVPRIVMCNWQVEEQKTKSSLGKALLRAIALTHDPHTLFFDGGEARSFQNSIAGDGKSIGIYYEKDNRGNVLVGAILPGSSAWKSNRINEGDKILSLKTGNVVLSSFNCMNATEIENMINLSDSEVVEIELEKTGGEKTKVKLLKELASVEENVINSAILKNDQVAVGYISLPAFYNSSSYFIDKGCANDLAKEIMKLSKDNIDALILDLRYNGGGDMHEAKEIAGLFIDVGPVGMYADRNGKTTILKEMNKGVIYAGPLLIMVNSFSASASEVIAAAMQDYNRALIVGTQTFGKSTAQQITPLPIEKVTGEPAGYVKETVAMMHRITGETHQATGVLPDLQINDHLSNIRISEASEPNALKGSKVNKELIYKKLPQLPIDQLKQLSDSRKHTDEFWNWMVLQKEKWPTMQYEVTNHPDHFEKDIDRVSSMFEFETEMKAKLKSPFMFASSSSKTALLEFDKYLSEMTKQQSDQAESDYQLHEAFRIAQDFIKLPK
jgi:carboxyl-terminal processing protease